MPPRAAGAAAALAREDRRRAAARGSPPTLGADVPFFLEGGTALRPRPRRSPAADERPARRRGSSLVLPDFGVSTRDAYDWWDRQHADADEDFPSPAAWRMPVAFRRRDDVRNDLEALVAERHPEIGRIVAELKRAGRGPRGDVGKRFGGLRAVRDQARRADGGRRRSRPGPPDDRHANAEPRALSGARAALARRAGRHPRVP